MPDPQYGPYRIKECAEGTFLYNTNDAYVGRSLHETGEFSPDEARLFKAILRPGLIALDIGANIGALTIPMAKTGARVMAFEAQPAVCNLLGANIVLNGLLNARAVNAAVGAKADVMVVPTLEPNASQNFGGFDIRGHDAGEPVPVYTVDGLGLPWVHFMKIDVQGMEMDVLRGAEATIARCQPTLYVESETYEEQQDLLAWLHHRDYATWWHLPLLTVEDEPGHPLVSINILAIHKDSAPVSMPFPPAKLGQTREDAYLEAA